MKKQITRGLTDNNLLPQCNANFSDLYQNVGVGLEKFLMKCNSDATKQLDSTIRIWVIGDSISESWFNSGYFISDILEEIYPDKTFEIKQTMAGGQGARQMLGDLNSGIYYNPDLVVFMEWESNIYDYNACQTILRTIKERTSSEIVILPWTFRAPDMQFIYDNDIESYKEGATYKVRLQMMQLAVENGAKFIDWHTIQLQDLYTNKYNVLDYFAAGEVTHPKSPGLFYQQAAETLTAHLSANFITETTDLEDDVELVNNTTYITTPTTNNEVIHFVEGVDLPDIESKLSINGTFSTDYTYINRSNGVLISSTTNDYVDIVFEGIGFVLTYLANAIGEIGIKIDEKIPSSFLKNHESGFYTLDGSLVPSFRRPWKVIVNSNILDDDIFEQNFKLHIDSNDNNGSIAYTLSDRDTSTVIGTGNFNTDSQFNINGGQITIPEYYGGTVNAVEMQSQYLSGDYYFSIRKSFCDVIIVVDEDVTKEIRFTGLERKEHTLRLICNSGTIKLDTIKILK